MLTTTHQYLTAYPIDRSARRLILGTIHPHFHEKFDAPFFYGNELSLWKIFHRAFPEELADPSSLQDICHFLKKRQLAISDTIVTCKRLSPTALDKDLEIIEDNKMVLLETLLNSSIEEVLCTSGFGKNNAFKIFYNKMLGLPITAEIRKTRQAIVTLPGSKKQLLIKALYSPARTAIIGIGGSLGYKLVKHKMSVDEYRTELYRKAVSSPNS